MRILALSFIALSLASPAVAATIPIGPYNIDALAFVDRTSQVAGPPWADSNPSYMDAYGSHCIYPPPVSSLLVEPFPIAWGPINLIPEMIFQADFVNNAAVNGPGADILIVELEMTVLGGVFAHGGYMVAMPDGQGGYGAFRAYEKETAVLVDTTWPYITCGPAGGWLGYVRLWTIAIDLSDFGIADNASISSLRFSGLDGADPAAIAAIHSESPLPVQPTTWGKVKSLYR